VTSLRFRRTDRLPQFTISDRRDGAILADRFLWHPFVETVPRIAVAPVNGPVPDPITRVIGA
jgi:hypothetical protein